MTVVTRLYDSYDDAQIVMRDLKAIGVSDGEISITSSRSEVHEDETSNTAVGASAGAAIGGGAGLLAGLGMLAIPGVGPVVAAGWIAATLAGALAGATSGGIIGALTDMGHSSSDAEVYAEGLRRGGTLINVRTEAAREPEVTEIMDRSRPIDPARRREEYTNAGWTGFDPNAAPMGAAETEGERRARRVGM
jgi:hypothetical protein